MTKFDKFLVWVKKYWKILVGGALLVFGVIAAILLRRRSHALERAVLAADIATAQREVARLEGKREAIKGRIDAVDKRTADIDSALEENTKQITVRKTAVDSMTSEEKLKRFKELGY
jgi:chromosome segregation ATPase